MGMKPEHRARALADSVSVAIALLEDFEYMREAVPQSALPTRAAARRISAILRRLLLDDDLPFVAAPRIGKLLIRAPDNRPAYEAAKKEPFLYFESGYASPALWIRGVALKNPGERRPIPDLDPLGTVDLRLDNFLAQKVICYQGRWLSRKAVIKFAANIASGIHSRAPANEEEGQLERVSQAIRYQLNGSKLKIVVNLGAVYTANSRFPHAEGGINPVFLEMLAVAQYLLHSPKINELLELVRAEVYGQSAASITE